MGGVVFRIKYCFIVLYVAIYSTQLIAVYKRRSFSTCVYTSVPVIENSETSVLTLKSAFN